MINNYWSCLIFMIDTLFTLMMATPFQSKHAPSHIHNTGADVRDLMRIYLLATQFARAARRPAPHSCGVPHD
jgi:hypothetical protein